MKLKILNDCEHKGEKYTVLWSDKLFRRGLTYYPWGKLKLEREAVFGNDPSKQHGFCIGINKNNLNWKYHKDWLGGDGKIVSFNIDLYEEFNNSHSFEGWIKYTVSDSLGYGYIIAKEYFTSNIKIKEEECGYTEGYKLGYTGLKWL